jgi:hypothetical protein
MELHKHRERQKLLETAAVFSRCQTELRPPHRAFFAAKIGIYPLNRNWTTEWWIWECPEIVQYHRFSLIFIGNMIFKPWDAMGQIWFAVYLPSGNQTWEIHLEIDTVCMCVYIYKSRLSIARFRFPNHYQNRCGSTSCYASVHTEITGSYRFQRLTKKIEIEFEPAT